MSNPGLNLLTPVSESMLLLRLGLAILAGGLVGLERQLDHKPAGLRTHMLVSLGASLYILISIQSGMAQAEPSGVSRIMLGMIAGFGFLGAGEIFSVATVQPSDPRIQGLTSAAAIWVSAALGTAAGCGLWLLSLAGAGLTLLILRVIKKLEVYIR